MHRAAGLLLAVLLLLAGAHVPTGAFAADEKAGGKAGVFVLGVDGMDPVVLQRLMDEGKMPTFAKLAAEGSFQPLGTANPPQSPVAWSTFVTGMNPGGHGVFDFVHRDPKTYMPISSATLPGARSLRPTMVIGTSVTRPTAANASPGL